MSPLRMGNIFQFSFVFLIKEIIILIVWVDRTEPTIGGLQKRISEISLAVARAGYKVVIVTLEGSHSSENPFVEKV